MSLLCKGQTTRVARCHQLWGRDVWLCLAPLEIYPSRQKIRQWPGILNREAYVQVKAVFLRVHVINLKTIQNQVQYQKSLNSPWSQRESFNWNYLGKSWVGPILLLVWCDSIKLWWVTHRWMRNCLYPKPACPHGGFIKRRYNKRWQQSSCMEASLACSQMCLVQRAKICITSSWKQLNRLNISKWTSTDR